MTKKRDKFYFGNPSRNDIPDKQVAEVYQMSAEEFRDYLPAEFQADTEVYSVHVDNESVAVCFSRYNANQIAFLISHYADNGYFFDPEAITTEDALIN